MTTTTLGRAAEKLKRGAFLAAKNTYWRLHGAPRQRRHLFVAGVQRSGTNMLMDILEKSWLTDAYHERDPRAFDNYKMRERAVIDALVARSKAPVFVIKSLFELQELPQLMAHFSPAQTVWIVRSPYDTINSTLKSFRPHLVERVNRAVKPDCQEWLGAGMSAETRERVAPLVFPEMREEDAAAIQWYIRNVLFFEMGFDEDPRVLACRYETLVTHPEEEIRRICAFVDLPYVPRLSRGIFSTSIGKRRRPQISPPVEALCEALHQRFKALTP